MTKLSMWTRRRNRKVTLFKKTDNKKHMKKFERAEFIMEHLEMIYPNTPIPLNHKSIFELLIAVLLSAQCTDCLLYTSPSPRDKRQSRMPSSA